jgi:hypothetical protein
MKTRFATALLALAALGLLACCVAGAAMIGIYRNEMKSTAQRSALVKLSGRSCSRSGVAGAMRITIGKRTESCSYRTPVIGRDLEIVATERLLSATPHSRQRKAYLAVELRAGGGTKYRLLVYPLQRKVQLARVTPEGASFLAIGKNESSVLGLDKANKLRLRAVNVKGGPGKGQAKLFGYVGSTLVAEATDEAAGAISGRASAVSVGAAKNGDGVVASVDDVVLRVPSPY